VVASVLVTAGVFASFALLQSISADLDGSVLGRLATRQTIGRLWVFFVLVPALLHLLSVGLPCLIRALGALSRGALGRSEITSLGSTAVGVSFVLAEAALRRSGTISLILLCLLCAWRLAPRLSTIGEKLQEPCLVITIVALLGFGAFQQKLGAGDAESVALAPTLFLIAFYATIVGAGTGLVGALAAPPARWRRAAVSLSWLAGYTGWIACTERWGAICTYGTCALFGLIALWRRLSAAR
jgi:hypothetical protein